MPGFLPDLPAVGSLVLRNARVPAALLASPPPASASGGDADGLAAVDIEIADGVVRRVEPAGTADLAGPAVDLRQGQVWPGFVDLHTHLDKGHIWPRTPNPDGTFAGALAATGADREGHWREADVRRRFAFALACAEAHGTVAIRTHLDSFEPQAETSWRVFRDLRDEWAGRIALQAVSLVTPDEIRTPFAETLADLVAESGGVLGAVTFMTPDIDAVLDRLFRLALDRGLALDLHVDESGDPAAASLGRVAAAALRHRFPYPIVCGHCCSLAVQDEATVARTLDLVGEAGIAVVSLPMCNLYLQDRVPGRTPRWRGVTLLHEMAARGIPAALASDNCRDPFYGYGDHDMLEVLREGARIAHLDRPVGSWPRAVAATPAALMSLDGRGSIAPGRPADLVLFRGRGWSELLSRPQADRVVLRRGRPIDATPPDYAELDDLLETRA